MTQFAARAFHLFVCASMIASLSATGNAQFTASIGGTVKDAAGALISGANVTVTNVETGKSQQTITGDEGFFRVSGLPPGKYTVTADASGFKKKVIENLVLHAEEAQGVNITLEAGQVRDRKSVV